MLLLAVLRHELGARSAFKSAKSSSAAVTNDSSTWLCCADQILRMSADTSSPLLVEPPAAAAAAAPAPLPQGVDDLTVQSVHDGSSMPLGSLWRERTTMLVFLRHWM